MTTPAARCVAETTSVDGDPVAAPSGSPGLLNPAGESCITENSSGRLTMTNCVVRTPTNATCLFNVDGTKTEVLAAAHRAEPDGGVLPPDAGVDMKFVAYPGAVHAFTNPGATEVGKKFGIPLAYDEDADKKSWAELQTFLGEVFAD